MNTIRQNQKHGRIGDVLAASLVLRDSSDQERGAAGVLFVRRTELSGAFPLPWCAGRTATSLFPLSGRGWQSLAQLF